MCTSSTCNSNGVCVTLGSHIYCICHNGFHGVYCESGADPCENNTCENGATCASIGDQYLCLCADGFTGFRCNLPIVNGGFSEWSAWSACGACNLSAEAPPPVRQRTRTCTAPAPQNGGEDCQGDTVEDESCIWIPCQSRCTDKGCLT